MTSASDRLKARAAATPAKPPPTITMRFRRPPSAPAFDESSPTRGKGASRARCRTPSNVSLLAHLSADHWIDVPVVQKKGGRFIDFCCKGDLARLARTGGLWGCHGWFFILAA